MTITNLGDSGLMIIRNGKSHFKTEDQMHGFNHPFQLESSDFAGDLLEDSGYPTDSVNLYFYKHLTYFIGYRD